MPGSVKYSLPLLSARNAPGLSLCRRTASSTVSATVGIGQLLGFVGAAGDRVAAAGDRVAAAGERPAVVRALEGGEIRVGRGLEGDPERLERVAEQRAVAEQVDPDRQQRPLGPY